MLVLTRKLDQKIVLDGNITITIVAIKGGSVRIGIDAPPDVSIRRDELVSLLCAAEAKQHKKADNSCQQLVLT